MSLWENLEDMRAFKNQGAHAFAMLEMSDKVAKGGKVFTYEAEAMPPWKEAKERLNRDGKDLTKFIQGLAKARKKSAG